MFVVPWLAATTLISVADRTELRARPELGSGDDTVVIDAETRPELALSATTRRTRLDLRYGITLTAYDVAEPDVTIYQSIDGNASYRLRHALLYLRESSGYGQRNLRLAGLSAPASASAAPAEPAEPNAPMMPPTSTPVPNRTADQSLSYASVSIGAGSTLQLTRRLSLNVELNYAASGGLDDDQTTPPDPTRCPAAPIAGQPIDPACANVNTYPLQRVESAQARLDAQVSRKDALAWRGNASRFETSPEITAFVGTGEQLYLRRFGRDTTLSLSAGAAYVEYRASSQVPTKREVQPVASADLDISHRRGEAGTSFGVDLSLAPIVDRRTGLVDERANFTLRGAVLRGRWSFGAQGAGTRSIHQDTVSSLTVLQGSGALGYAWSKQVRGELGSALTLQSTGGDDTLHPIWGVFAAVTFQSVPKRL
jgi:hypothetical protein